jgi:hypothetical protein
MAREQGSLPIVLALVAVVATALWATYGANVKALLGARTECVLVAPVSSAHATVRHRELKEFKSTIELDGGM